MQLNTVHIQRTGTCRRTGTCNFCVQEGKLTEVCKRAGTSHLHHQIDSKPHDHQQFINKPNSFLTMATLSSTLQSLQSLVSEEFECPICLQYCTDTHLNPDCNHRFCGICIKKCIRKCNHECPTCRERIPTYRQLRRDGQFDRIVSLISSLLRVDIIIFCGIYFKIMRCHTSLN